MDHSIFKRTLFAFSAFGLLLGSACKSNKTTPKTTTESKVEGGEKTGEEKKEEKKPEETEPKTDVLSICPTPKGANGKPETIEEFIQLINALPKPVSVACALDALTGPFLVNATENMFSGQPAHSSEFPRIFLFLGAKLIVSVVPKGEGGRVVEFGYRVDETSTVKGELHFPVTETLKEDSAYTSILDSSGSATLCRICHSPETAAPSGFPASALASRYVPADVYYDVPLTQLQKSQENCKNSETDECLLLRVLFKKGVSAGQF